MKGEGWESVAFEELAEFHDRRRIPLSKKERVGRSGPFPYYGAQGIIDWVDDYIFDGRYLLIAEDGENLRSRKQAVAYTADGQFWVNNHAHVVKAMRGVADDDFLRAYVEFHPLSGLITGAAQPKLSQSNLKRLPVSAPPYAVQAKIGEAIRAVDSFLKNNRRRIEVLEEVARLLYREWFVHFRYPGHEGVELVDSDLGPIPEGWAWRNLFDLAEVGFGFSFKSKQFAESGSIRVVRIRDVPKNTTRTYTNEDPGERYEIHDGDTLIGMDGDFHMCRWAGGLAHLNQRVARLRSKGSLSQLHLHLALEQPIQEFNRTIIGTTVAHLGKRHLEEIFIAEPPSPVLASATERFQPIFELELNIRKQNRVLHEARDLLLPRLVSGELDVSELDLGLVAVGL